MNFSTTGTTPTLREKRAEGWATPAKLSSLGETWELLLAVQYYEIQFA